MSAEPLLSVRSLSFRYPNGQPALQEVSFTLHAGESVGLIGPNGAGKTSLFLCLVGVRTPQQGSITLDGLDPRSAADRKQLPARVGIVFQNSDDQLFNPTVGEDVAFGPLNLGLPAAEVDRRTEEALEQMRLADCRDRVPFQLSGGQKRRAALAGVLAMRPKLLLLDEPSMFLDARGRRELIQLLPTLPGAKLIASHDLRFIEETCSRVLLLDAGRLIDDRPTRELLADAELLAQHGLER